jgi:hypothetical protein
MPMLSATQTASNDRIVNDQWIAKYLEGSCGGQIKTMSWNLLGVTEKSHDKGNSG